ncbi:MAG: HAD-IG family 5'-nucleotidase [Myxococcota bacterium]|nr:HAD-IG family 5'-nucleotidase [Myxococcota bacterium]
MSEERVKREKEERMGPADPPRIDLSMILESSEPSNPNRRIYTNRDLQMEEIEVIGFDMDYTLAQYHQRALDELSVALTLEKLLARGYPEHFRSIQIDHDFIIRGLIVDKETGHIFKLDDHRVVGRCYHGYQQISDEERVALYGSRPISLSGSRFARVDTLFSLPETTLLAGIIEDYVQRGETLPCSHRVLFDDIRASIDEAHRDGSLKAAILSDISKYIILDKDLGPTLHKLRSAGKKLFLLTNSECYYTEAVMSYLLNNSLAFFDSWRDYFDIILVDGAKPAFFNEEKKFIRLDEEGAPSGEETHRLAPRRVYSGGCLTEFERLLGLNGDAILYVGDHVYSDIVRSKRSAWWRTALVIQEMQHLDNERREHGQKLERIQQLDEIARQLDDEINHYQTLSQSLGRVQELILALTTPETQVIDSTREQAARQIAEKRSLLEKTISEIRSLEEEIDRQQNPYWGRVFREGHELSLFGDQVRLYADIYTSQVSNLLYYSPNQHFRGPRRLLPHEADHISST